MLRTTIILLLFSFLLSQGFSQTNEEMDVDRRGISVWLSTDSLSQDNYLEVKFTIHNLDGKFKEPDFRDFKQISGPRVNQSISVINGVRRSTQSYSFLLSPLTTGISNIESITYELEGHTLITDEIAVVISDKKLKDRSPRESKKGITLFYTADNTSAPTKKKKIIHFKKRKV